MDPILNAERENSHSPSSAATCLDVTGTAGVHLDVSYYVKGEPARPWTDGSVDDSEEPHMCHGTASCVGHCPLLSVEVTTV